MSSNLLAKLVPILTSMDALTSLNLNISKLPDASLACELALWCSAHNVALRARLCEINTRNEFMDYAIMHLPMFAEAPELTASVLDAAMLGASLDKFVLVRFCRKCIKAAHVHIMLSAYVAAGKKPLQLSSLRISGSCFSHNL